MRFSICLVLILNLAFSKDVRYKIQNSNQQSGNYISLNGSTSNSNAGLKVLAVHVMIPLRFGYKILKEISLIGR